MARTIYVIWLREMIKFRREPARMATSLIQPLIWLFVVGKGFGSVFPSPFAHLTYVQFMFPGVVGMTILFTALFSSVSILWDREFGFLKGVLVAPVPSTGIVLGKAASGATLGAIQGALILALGPTVGMPYRWEALLAALGLMLLLSLAVAAAGIAVAVRITSFQTFQVLMNLIVMPLFFLSGAIFPVRGLPLPLRVLSDVDPLTYGVDAMKGVLLHQHEFPLSLDLGVVFLLTAGLTALATVLFRRSL